MQKKLSWQVFSNDDRSKVIEAVKNTISKSDGCIMNLESKKEWLIFMNISFGRGKGDLKHKIPE